MRFTGNWPIHYRIDTPKPCPDGQHSYPDPKDSRCMRCAAPRDVPYTWADHSLDLARAREAGAAGPET